MKENSKTLASRRLPCGTNGKHAAGTEGVGCSTLLREGCDGDGGKSGLPGSFWQGR